MSRSQKIFFTTLAALLAANLFYGGRVYSAITRSSGEDRGYMAMRQFAGVLKLIRRSYVDEERTDYTHLIYGAMNGMLASLDRFSSFIPPKSFKQMEQETEGEFGGIGIVVSIKDGALVIISPQEGSPGEKAGLHPGDRIIKVDGKSTASLPMNEAVNMIKGKPGTKVTLTVLRPSTKKILTFTVTRAIIEISTIKDAHLLDDHIGYIRITQFNEKTAEKLREALVDLRLKFMRGLILDLRNNPGGLLTSAIDVCSIFLPLNWPIVSTEGRHKSQHQEFFSRPGKKFLHIPIIILINGNSASAAEIVSGCLRDSKRALLVGERSFGKGCVQSIIELADKSAVRLTTAYYYTPSKRVIQDHGIPPDVTVDISDKDAAKLYLQRNHLYDPEKKKPDSIPDIQMEKALELMKNCLRGGRLPFAPFKIEKQSSPAATLKKPMLPEK